MDYDTKTNIYTWMRNSYFPREFGLFRNIIYSIDDIVGESDIYLSIHSLNQKVRDEFDTMYIDIDAHSEKDDLKQKYSKFIKSLEKYSIPLPTRLYYSGRGVAAYFDFDEPVSGAFYKLACRFLISKLGLKEVVDPSVIGDFNRMARVPGFINSKSSSYMVSVDPNFAVEDMRIASQNNVFVRYRGRRINFKKLVTEFGFEEDKIFTFRPEIEVNFEKFTEQEYPPCIKRAINDIVETGELDHVERVHLASFLLKNGERNKAEGIFSLAGDYNYSYTKYQLDYIQSHGGYLYSCNSVPSSICPYDNKSQCIYYPSIQHSFDARIKKGAV